MYFDPLDERPNGPINILIPEARQKLALGLELQEGDFYHGECVVESAGDGEVQVDGCDGDEVVEVLEWVEGRMLV